MTQRQFRLNSPSTVHQLALNQRSLLFFVSHLGPLFILCFVLFTLLFIIPQRIPWRSICTHLCPIVVFVWVLWLVKNNSKRRTWLRWGQGNHLTISSIVATENTFNFDNWPSTKSHCSTGIKKQALDLGKFGKSTIAAHTKECPL